MFELNAQWVIVRKLDHKFSLWQLAGLSMGPAQPWAQMWETLMYEAPFNSGTRMAPGLVNSSSSWPSSASAPYLVVTMTGALNRKELYDLSKLCLFMAHGWTDMGSVVAVTQGNRPVGRRKTRPGHLPALHTWRIRMFSWWTGRRNFRKEK